MLELSETSLIANNSWNGHQKDLKRPIIIQKRIMAPIVRSVNIAKPVLRWAGGKAVLVPHLLRAFPPGFTRYVDPMLGGGALFFNFGPDKSLLADANDDLINFYTTLRDDGEALVSRLIKMRASRLLYYRLRRERPRTALNRAIRFAYLNRLCWNGLYRVNRSGQFNVPMGDRRPKDMFSVEHMLRASRSLKTAAITSADFEITMRSVTRGDFVFLDPPYPKRAKDKLGFNRYHQNHFTIEDHRRLADAIKTLTKLRIPVLLTLGDSPNVLAEYPNAMRRRYLSTQSLIACNGEGRVAVKEVLLTNYTI